MTGDKALSHWEIMQKMAPVLSEKTVAWRKELFNNNVFSVKETQLITLAVCCATRHLPGVKVHAQLAAEAGASKDELFMTAALSMIVGGVVSYGDSVKAMKEAGLLD